MDVTLDSGDWPEPSEWPGPVLSAPEPTGPTTPSGSRATSGSESPVLCPGTDWSVTTRQFMRVRSGTKPEVRGRSTGPGQARIVIQITEIERYTQT